ncbi:MAG: hypothetical protein JWM68_1184 [Verrucomicrobiales bacterium]|nr:hypothetical protein [Verrucomicrobiales bacterium]
MDIFTIFGLTIGGAGFVMAVAAWIQIGTLQRKLEAQRREIDELKKQVAGEDPSS